MRYASKLPMTLLPKVPGLKLENAAMDAEAVSFTLATTSLPAICPVCARETARLHSHYGRTVADLPWGGRRVRLLLNVRKFRCPEEGSRDGSSPNACLTSSNPTLARRCVCTRSWRWWASRLEERQVLG